MDHLEEAEDLFGVVELDETVAAVEQLVAEVSVAVLEVDCVQQPRLPRGRVDLLESNHFLPGLDQRTQVLEVQRIVDHPLGHQSTPV